MHRTRKTAVVGAALATTALTLSSIGVAAQDGSGFAELDHTGILSYESKEPPSAIHPYLLSATVTYATL